MWIYICQRGAHIQAKEEETSAQIALLAAELKKMQWEKTIVEQQAETLKTALAVRTGGSAEVCFSHPFIAFYAT